MTSPSFGVWMRLLRELAGQTRSGFSPWPTCLVGPQLHWQDGFRQGCQLGSPLTKSTTFKKPTVMARLGMLPTKSLNSAVNKEMRRSLSSRSVWRKTLEDEPSELVKMAKFMSSLLPSLNRKLRGKEYSSFAHAVEAAQIEEQRLGETERRMHQEDWKQHGRQSKQSRE